MHEKTDLFKFRGGEEEKFGSTAQNAGDLAGL